MVESNRDEERLARIEHMVEALQREQAAAKVITAKILLAVAVLAPNVPADSTQALASLPLGERH